MNQDRVTKKKRGMKVSLAELIVRNVPFKAMDFISASGMTPNVNPQIMIQQVNYIVSQREKQGALKETLHELAKIHPHRELILEAERFNDTITVNPENQETKNDFCGCPNTKKSEQEKQSRLQGDEQPQINNQPKIQQKDNTLTYVVLSVIGLVVLTTILKEK